MRGARIFHYHWERDYNWTAHHPESICSCWHSVIILSLFVPAPHSVSVTVSIYYITAGSSPFASKGYLWRSPEPLSWFFPAQSLRLSCQCLLLSGIIISSTLHLLLCFSPVDFWGFPPAYFPPVVNCKVSCSRCPNIQPSSLGSDHFSDAGLTSYCPVSTCTF